MFPQTGGFPKKKSPVEEFFSSFGDVSVKVAKAILPEALFKIVKINQKTKLSDQVYTRLPFDIVID